MPSFSRPSFITREYSSIRSESSTAFGNRSMGACVCEGAIIGRRCGSAKLGSLVPILEHCWHTMRVAPSTSDLPGLPTISCLQISQNKGSGSLWARTLEIAAQDAYVGIGFRMLLQLVKPRLHELRRIRVVANYQFGKGASEAFPKTTLITRSPNTHRIRHIYNNTELLATYRPKDGLLALSIPGGQALRGIFKPPRLRVEVVPGVEEFIKKGGNVFCKHVQQVDPELRPAEEVLVVNEEDRLLAVGRSFFNAEEMLSFKIGVAVKVRHGIEG